MPTLIRLIVALIFIGGIGFAGLYALTVFVDPGEKTITVRIPARDIALTPVVPAPPAPAPVAEAAPPPNTDDPNAKEVDTQE